MSQLFTSGGQYIGASTSASVLPMNILLISFRINCLDLLAVQGTLRSLLQHHSSKTSILWHSVFFMVHLSYPYMTTGETTALARRTFGGKVMPRLFNTLSRFITKEHASFNFMLQSPYAVILEPKKIKSITVLIVSPSICHEVMESDAIMLVF